MRAQLQPARTSEGQECVFCPILSIIIFLHAIGLFLSSSLSMTYNDRGPQCSAKRERKGDGMVNERWGWWSGVCTWTSAKASGECARPWCDGLKMLRCCISGVGLRGTVQGCSRTFRRCFWDRTGNEVLLPCPVPGNRAGSLRCPVLCYMRMVCGLCGRGGPGSGGIQNFCSAYSLVSEIMTTS